MTNYKTEQEKQDKEFGEKFLVELKNNSGWKLPRIALYWEESGSNGYEWEDMEKDLKSYLLARDTALLEAFKKDVGEMKEKLIKKLELCKDLGNADIEAAHFNADEALLDYLNDKEIIKAYSEVPKWYA